jgi:hypothetical protein
MRADSIGSLPSKPASTALTTKRSIGGRTKAGRSARVVEFLKLYGGPRILKELRRDQT